MSGFKGARPGSGLKVDLVGADGGDPLKVSIIHLGQLRVTCKGQDGSHLQRERHRDSPR